MLPSKLFEHTVLKLHDPKYPMKLFWAKRPTYSFTILTSRNDNSMPPCYSENPLAMGWSSSPSQKHWWLAEAQTGSVDKEAQLDCYPALCRSIYTGSQKARQVLEVMTLRVLSDPCPPMSGTDKSIKNVDLLPCFENAICFMGIRASLLMEDKMLLPD